MRYTLVPQSLEKAPSSPKKVVLLSVNFKSLPIKPINCKSSRTLVNSRYLSVLDGNRYKIKGRKSMWEGDEGILRNQNKIGKPFDQV